MSIEQVGRYRLAHFRGGAAANIGFEVLYSRSLPITVTVSFSQSLRNVQLNRCLANFGSS